MDNINYYEILGLKKDASVDEIKRKYRILAKKYHPDTNEGNTSSAEMFKRINNAYHVLSDAEKRKNYDKTLNYDNNICVSKNEDNTYSDGRVNKNKSSYKGDTYNYNYNYNYTYNTTYNTTYNNTDRESMYDDSAQNKYGNEISEEENLIGLLFENILEFPDDIKAKDLSSYLMRRYNIERINPAIEFFLRLISKISGIILYIITFIFVAPIRLYKRISTFVSSVTLLLTIAYFLTKGSKAGSDVSLLILLLLAAFLLSPLFIIKIIKKLSPKIIKLARTMIRA